MRHFLKARPGENSKIRGRESCAERRRSDNEFEKVAKVSVTCCAQVGAHGRTWERAAYGIPSREIFYFP